MEWADEDWVPLSALEHYAYCPRQWALIYVERVWDENPDTINGAYLHQRMDEPSTDVRGGLRVIRALPIWSERLGVIGRADMVELGEDGTPYPVEAKPNKLKYSHAHDVQLCAQGMCLEEMWSRPVRAGALVYFGSHRRREVAFTCSLRHEVEQIAIAVRASFQKARMLPATNDARCRECSLQDHCVRVFPTDPFDLSSNDEGQ